MYDSRRTGVAECSKCGRLWINVHAEFVVHRCGPPTGQILADGSITELEHRRVECPVRAAMVIDCGQRWSESEKMVRR